MTPPTTIGPYRVVRSLGQGGMGEVSLAYDDRLRRHVALKSVLERTDGRDTASALINEARAAAALSHPGIASIFDIIEEQDRAYIVMEFVEGETLAARLRGGPLAGPVAMNVATQLCAALDAAHTQHVIHRDLKPGNIMIGPDGRAKILDFGLAKHATVAAPSAPTTELSSASIGSGMGTVGYMAPEQILGEAVDRRCDIFSLGAVLFEVFTGRRPFIERDAVAYGVRVTTTDAPRATAINASVSPAVSAVIAKALARKPSDRFESASALSQSLLEADQRPSGAASLTETTPIPVPVRRRWPIAAAALALVGAIAGALAMIALPSMARLRTAEPAGISILGVLPAHAGANDDRTRAIAAGVTATVMSNASRVTSLTVVQLAAIASADHRADIDRVLRNAGATWALDLFVRPSPGAIAIEASLFKVGDEKPAWRMSFTGDELTATQRLLDGLLTGLAAAGVVDRLADENRRRLVATTTARNVAFVAYSQGRRCLTGSPNQQTPEAAVQFFQQAIDADPQYALAYAGLADAYFEIYKRAKDPALIERATEAATHALSLDPAQAAVQLALASIWNQTGRPDQALQAVDQAIRLQPASDDAHRMRGRFLSQATRYDEAIDALQHAVSLRPTFATNHSNLGLAFYRAGRMPEAAAAYRRVTELAPDFADGFQMLGTVLYQLGDTAQAIGNLEHAVRLGPSATAYSNLAYSYYEAGRFDEALKAYQESIVRDATRPLAHRNIGDVYARLGQAAKARASYEAAIAAAERLVKVNPNDAITIAVIALCEVKLGRNAAAERHAAEALALRPKDREVVLKNAEVFAHLQQRDRAVDYLRQAIALGYDAASARKNSELASLQKLPAFESVIAAAPPPLK